jgi:hypothetical protein
MDYKLPSGFKLAGATTATAEQQSKQKLETIIGRDIYSDYLAQLQQAKKDHGYTDEWLHEQTVQLNRDWCHYVRSALAEYSGVVKGLQERYEQIQNTNFVHSYTERDYADFQFLQTLIKTRIVNECQNSPVLVERVLDEFIRTEKGAQAIMFLSNDSQIGKLIKPYYSTAAINAKTAAEKQFDADKAARLDKLDEQIAPMIMNQVIGQAALKVAEERVSKDEAEWAGTFYFGGKNSPEATYSRKEVSENV